jgi:multidrug resistance efflux pump
MYTLYPSAGGTLLQWEVGEGSYVNKDQVLGRTQTLPYISSPIKGTVVQNNVKENQTVGVSTLLAVVADTDNLYIGVNIKETEISKLSIGQKAEVKIDAYPGVKFEGTVTDIGSTTQTYFSNMTSFTTSGTYTKVTQYIPVKVEIKNPKNYLLIFGMNSTVRLFVK